MADVRMLHSLRLTDVLSFGPAGQTIELEALNVLIGPNASGKSNVIEAIALLKAMPRQFAKAMAELDGVQNVLWKGELDAVMAGAIGTLLVSLGGPSAGSELWHSVSLLPTERRWALYESIRDSSIDAPGPGIVYFHHQPDSAEIWLGSAQRYIKVEEDQFDLTESVLSQRRDPVLYPEVTHIARQYEHIQIYQDLAVGRRGAARRPQPADLSNGFLEPDGSNLALVVNNLEQSPVIRRELLARLREFYPRIVDFRTKTEGGSIQLYFEEEGLHATIPATRMSEGTLRYLCLLTILCHPNPPPLICLDEPEIGLHPDIMPTLGQLLVEASERTQLIVTTHSDALLGALDAHHVLVCERDDGGTTLRRLDYEELREWLDEYTLGDLWRMGHLGGNAL